MLKRKALWLLLATGIVLQFDCVPEPLSFFNSATFTNFVNSLVGQLPANIQAIINGLRNFLPGI
jgi:hypothetical protein